jgi:hypothetical protein
MGLPTMIMANMTNEQLEAYTLHLRIEEISQKLRINDVVPADGDRYAARFNPPLVLPLLIFWASVGHRLLLHSMTTLVAVSILVNTAIESASRMSATSSLRRQ